MKYTLTSVKFTLPNVTVRLESGEIASATVRGRQLEFARVNLPDGRNFEYSWLTIVDSLNKDSPLII